MGHIRLGTLPRSRKWRDVVGLVAGGADVDAVAEAAACASEHDLASAADDPRFQFVARLLVHLPMVARAPGLEGSQDFGIDVASWSSVPALLGAISAAAERQAFDSGRASDAGLLARSALIETLSREFDRRLPSLFSPTASEIRSALGRLAGGEAFASFARDFFSNLTYRSLDYYLSRELAAHTGPGRRFASDAERVRFQEALAQHTFEASRVIKEYAGGWYGKHVWRGAPLDPASIHGFAAYAFKKMRSELGRRRAAA